MQGGAHDKHARVREVAIHISNHTVRKEDHGMVVVGGSLEMGDLTGQALACFFIFQVTSDIFMQNQHH